MNIESILLDVQEQIFNAKGIRTDVHYSDGQGALVVLEGYPLHPSNVILTIPEIALRFGNKLNINF